MPVPPATNHESLLARGDVLDGRYRIDAPAGDGWKATDLLVHRPVAVHAVRLGAGITVRQLRDVVARTSAVGDARFVRLLDFGVQRRPRIAYLVSEWVAAPPLSQRLATDGPLDAPTAVAMAAEVAAALVAAEEHGIPQGRLDADRVFLLPDGTVRIAAAGLASMTATERDEPPAADGDLDALRLLLRHAVPPQRDRRTNALLRRLDDVRTLPVAAAMLAEEARVRGLPAAPPVPHRLPRLALHAAALAIVVAVALLSWREGFQLGTVPSGAPPARVASAGGVPAAATIPIVALRAAAAPGLPAQHPAQALLAADHNPATAWWTTTFATPTFGPGGGVGLLCDLGSARLVTAVTIRLTVPGATVLVYAGNNQDIGPGHTPPVAQVTRAARTESVPISSAPARFWLVWLTRLPAHGTGFADGVAELSFQP